MPAPPSARDDLALVADPTGVARVVAGIEAAGRFALDLEFVSEDRYVPELALVQVAWGDPAGPEVAAIDPLAVDVAPVVALVDRSDLEVIAHAARQDLGLLAARFGTRARGLVDTQLACAFVGLAEQVGYGRMVAELVGATIDKGSQYTAWARRPLSPRQLAYALDDVRYLLRCWDALAVRLDAAGRRAWLLEESDALAELSATRRPPEEAWRQVGGAGALRPPALGALVRLAAWREREALASNTPPSWLVPDPALIELARRTPRTPRDLGRIRGVPGETIERHGAALLAALAEVEGQPAVAGAARTLGPRGQAWSPIVGGLVHGLAVAADLPPRLVAARADVEELCAWVEAGGDSEAGVALLTGWRREVAGAALLDFLRGRRAVVADLDAPGGIRLA